jgi:hypothetical protein
LYTGTSREVKSVDPFPAKDLPTQDVFSDHIAKRGKEKDESVARLRD